MSGATKVSLSLKAITIEMGCSHFLKACQVSPLLRCQQMLTALMHNRRRLQCELRYSLLGLYHNEDIGLISDGISV